MTKYDEMLKQQKVLIEKAKIAIAPIMDKSGAKDLAIVKEYISNSGYSAYNTQVLSATYGGVTLFEIKQAINRKHQLTGELYLKIEPINQLSKRYKLRKDGTFNSEVICEFVKGLAASGAEKAFDSRKRQDAYNIAKSQHNEIMDSVEITKFIKSHPYHRVNPQTQKDKMGGHVPVLGVYGIHVFMEEADILKEFLTKLANKRQGE